MPIHVHVENADGRAKFSLEPDIELIYGIKKPSVERMQKIRQAFHMMGQELIAV